MDLNVALILLAAILFAVAIFGKRERIDRLVAGGLLSLTLAKLISTGFLGLS